ncbi:predicted protein [Arabidopsis lyrata subsp. lyrata]|uniref:Predicted protein n=1 Tax=Arabidopsis lyrata subsp. lyrata TaxID=81972 RepID=D7LP81_ARALL|nr:predicted protein [Arabidopsis lyrata subsp. lyrata]
MEPHHYLSDLNVHSTRWLVHVKILSLWKEPTSSWRTEIKMILADEKGNRIDATIPNRHYHWNFLAVLKPGLWYRMSDFEVVRPDEKKTKYSCFPVEIKCIADTTMWPITVKCPYSFFDFVFPQTVEFAQEEEKEFVTGIKLAVLFSLKEYCSV